MEINTVSQNTSAISTEEKEWIADLTREYFITSEKVFKWLYIPKKVIQKAMNQYATDADEGSILCLIDTTTTFSPAGIVFLDDGIIWSPKGYKNGQYLLYSQINEVRIDKTIGEKGLYLNDFYLQVNEKDLLPVIESFFFEILEHFNKVWLLLIDENPKGPFSALELKDAMSSEGIDPLNCKVRKVGDAKWLHISNYPELEYGVFKDIIPHAIPSEDIENTKNIDLEKYTRWQCCKLNEGLTSFSCKKCNRTQELESNLFYGELSKDAENIVPIEKTQSFKSGKLQSTGKIIAFIAALFIGSIIAIVMGKIPLLFAVFTIVLYPILKPISVRLRTE